MFKINSIARGNMGKLTYNKESKEFDTRPNINSDITILVAYINIGFDSDTMVATQIWGIHHDFNWIETEVNSPKIVEGSLQLDIDVEAGTSKRIEEANSWKTYYDSKSGWIKFGMEENESRGFCVEVSSGTILEVDKNGNLVALWLHPIVV